ncbi:unnamed protein product [Ilex paraguariensis]|uniref:Peroxidase n=1 Tax=Ilex paraguariensis TaxID=185542 RepID=A0ABC8TP86_9AQUA
MGREGFLLLISLLSLALSFRSSCVQAAITLPPEDRPLTRHYYKKLITCKNVEAFVQHQVMLFWNKEKSLTAKLLKLLYSDCMVNGCDASILLDGPQSEKTAPQNAGLGAKLPNLGLTVFDVIDKIKIIIEDRCPGAVSCTDILNLATRDAVHYVKSSTYTHTYYHGYKSLLSMLKYYHESIRDGLESKAEWVYYPSPSISWESALAFFRSKGLDVQDMATLLGAHTMGKAHCSYILDRLYNFNNTGKPDPSMKKSLLTNLRKQCPPKSKTGQSNPLVFLNPDNGPNYKFTNSYYSRVLSHKSVLAVDQQLLYGSSNGTKQLTNQYAGSFEDFGEEFALSISRMGGLKVLTGNKGEIRRNCRSTNIK